MAMSFKLRPLLLGAVLVVMLLAAAKQGEATPECTEEGFFPNLDDCSRFYRCVDFDGSFTKFDFQCGPGTVFHPELITCVHPWQQDPSAECLAKDSSS
ncbi:hypothetical protein KC19_5G194700 [Ceratodon purpureus]|uniref:Chitin-binding type-2 domain-containing protein n=1 Tax=Ceratodon purpureus TaxID=3225 RepID=A0A8T0I3B8_CERPU|nr:hypothetical protein KC19_5G194700 [Ceratodon purpureus]